MGAKMGQVDLWKWKWPIPQNLIEYFWRPFPPFLSVSAKSTCPQRWNTNDVTVIDNYRYILEQVQFGPYKIATLDRN